MNKGLGQTFNYFDDYNNAIIHFKSSLSNGVEEYGYSSIKVALLIDMLGNSYYYLKDYQNAIKCFKEALEIIIKVNSFGSSNNKANISSRYSKIGACYTNLKQFESANYYLNKSVDYLHFNNKKKYPFGDITSNRTHLLITLYFKAKNHQKAYEAGRGMEQLYEAAYWFGQCIELIEYINSTFEESGSKQYLLDRFYYIFEAAINCKYHLHQETDSLQYLEQAFGYAERSKALLLKEAMQMADANFEFGIPESVLEEERRLKKAIIERENQRYELQHGQEGPYNIHDLNNEIFNLKQEHHRVMDSIQQQYPKAHRLRYAVHPMVPEQIQQELLNPSQALLQYFVGEEYIFLFVIDREKATLIKRPIEEGLPDAVRKFRESIYGWSQSQGDSLARQYADYGYQLYQRLVQPVAHLLPEHLIIIPDGILEYVPFEALLRQATPPGTQSYASYPYLIRDHQISYAHSAQLLQEMKATDYQAPRQWILAFAPSFQDPPSLENTLASRRRSLGRLMNNVKEVQSIKSLLRTRIYKGTDATRERFLADAPHYSIIHLATHAKANDEEGEYSYLAFTEIPDSLQNELLYAKDLYSLRLQAEMVVLSACESGVGELRRGEGVISLARGFSYAGAKSLVTTLWRVSDRESAVLMQLFYRQLKEGKPKDEALRVAKLQFIDQNNGARAHPFFWGAFILSGDMAPIAVDQPTFTLLGFALLGVLFVFLSAHFAKRKPN
ncbi:MAG: CHAT domain-containing protein [Phaeodactylibacter sp.]|nr:CHAT domain-containing protein [Phaeodactylibacter sp.]